MTDHPAEITTIKNDHYNLLVDEVKSTIKEAVFRSRTELIEGHWMVGKLIREYSQDDTTNLLQDLAGDVGLSERTLWYSLKCFDTYPTLDDLQRTPEGCNISWNKLITKYLTDSKPKNEEDEEVLYTCPVCGFKFTKEDL
jgi:hypothetical protein